MERSLPASVEGLRIVTRVQTQGKWKRFVSDVPTGTKCGKTTRPFARAWNGPCDRAVARGE